jgi:hypothetical protein
MTVSVHKGGVMKAVMVILLIFISIGFVFTQDFPVAGNWRLQVLGTREEISIEIDHTTWTFGVDGNTVPQIVTIDNDKKTVTIPLLAGLADYYFFDINNDYIDLKAGGKFNFPMLDIMRREMTEMEGINEVTDDFVEKIVIEIESAFYKVPIMRLYRN